jgi:ABC-2 type transport system ATP-binding protein
MTNAQPMIEVSSVRCHYGAHQVLGGVQLTVRQGEVYALLGGNGAGKSTLLHVILGFVVPTEGNVSVAGHDVRTDTKRARSQIAYVPENVALYEQLSARENMRYLLGLAGLKLAAVEIESALDQVGFEAGARDRQLGSYSKGMRQRVALALAVARKAPVLLLDEPSSGLDPRAIEELNELILALKGQGVTVLMATHDLLAASQLADRVGFMSNGILTEEVTSPGGRHDLRLLQARFSSRSVPA